MPKAIKKQEDRESKRFSCFSFTRNKKDCCLAKRTGKSLAKTEKKSADNLIFLRFSTDLIFMN
jgi:hypothetical protein